ncbi:hypothetical protein [Celeribacter neptunius]|uniref:hypothetical protein n=1 Tax=Celeribacter neptunius TaxID=588602 RepID=UPI000B7DE3CD|nr:hypothetical protein [Celeribacter neptunius]
MALDTLTNSLIDGAAAQTVSGITTGYTEFDRHLYHGGWGRKELSCLLCNDGFGKSLALGDMAKNAVQAGFNVLYVALEVAKEIVARLIDNMPDETVSDASECGILKVVDFPLNELTAGALDAALVGCQMAGTEFDLIVVDCPEFMASEGGATYRGLKRLAQKWNAAVLLTVSPNRDGAKSLTMRVTDIGCNWSNVNLFDVLLSLNATEAEEQAGEARLYWALSRNTSAETFSLRFKQDRDKLQFFTDFIGKEY